MGQEGEIKMDDFIEKMFICALQIPKVDIYQRRKIIIELSRIYSREEIAQKTGLTLAQIDNYKALRATDNKEDRFSLDRIYIRLMKIKPKDVTDKGRLEMIRDRCEELLREI